MVYQSFVSKDEHLDEIELREMLQSEIRTPKERGDYVLGSHVFCGICYTWIPRSESIEYNVPLCDNIYFRCEDSIICTERFQAIPSRIIDIHGLLDAYPEAISFLAMRFQKEWSGYTREWIFWKIPFKVKEYFNLLNNKYYHIVETSEACIWYLDLPECYMNSTCWPPDSH